MTCSLTPLLKGNQPCLVGNGLMVLTHSRGRLVSDLLTWNFVSYQFKHDDTWHPNFTSFTKMTSKVCFKIVIQGWESSSLWHISAVFMETHVSKMFQIQSDLFKSGVLGFQRFSLKMILIWVTCLISLYYSSTFMSYKKFGESFPLHMGLHFCSDRRKNKDARSANAVDWWNIYLHSKYSYWKALEEIIRMLCSLHINNSLGHVTNILTEQWDVKTNMVLSSLM